MLNRTVKKEVIREYDEKGNLVRERTILHEGGKEESDKIDKAFGKMNKVFDKMHDMFNEMNDAFKEIF